MGWLRRNVFANLGLKLLAVTIAVLLWWAVGHDPVAEVAISVPIEFTSVPPGLEISSERLPMAEVRVSGPVRIVRDVDASRVHPVVDLTGVRAGEHTVNLTGGDERPSGLTGRVRVPRDVRFLQVIPAQFRLHLDHTMTKEVEVKPRVIGTFAQGYRVASVRTWPTRVSITGPQNRVNAIESVVTDPVDASGVVGAATFTTETFVGDPLVRLTNPGPVRVTVETEKTPGK